MLYRSSLLVGPKRVYRYSVRLVTRTLLVWISWGRKLAHDECETRNEAGVRRCDPNDCRTRLVDNYLLALTVTLAKRCYRAAYRLLVLYRCFVLHVDLYYEAL